MTLCEFWQTGENGIFLDLILVSIGVEQLQRPLPQESLDRSREGAVQWVIFPRLALLFSSPISSLGNRKGIKKPASAQFKE